MSHHTTDLVCAYCGMPEDECASAQAGHSVHLVTPDEYQRIKESGDYE